MTRALDIPARQVTALCKGAAKAGYVPVVKVGKTVVVLVPENHDFLQQAARRIDEDEKGYL